MRKEIEDEIAELTRNLGQAPVGRLCPDILVPAEVLADESGAELVQAVVDFTNWAMNEALLLPCEFPVEALCAYYADFYLAQVNNGGHAQWACNSDFAPLPVKTAGWGLEAMGATDYLAIHQDFVRLMSDPEFARKILASEGGFNGRYDEEDALNTRFYALDPDFSYPMLKLSAAWMKSLPHLKALPSDSLDAARAAVIAADQQHAERRREAEAALAKSFYYWVPRKLCKIAGVEFLTLTAGNSIMAGGQRRFAWFMQTSAGLMAMAMFPPSFVSKPKVKLYRIGDGLVRKGGALAEVTITREDYTSHVPGVW